MAEDLLRCPSCRAIIPRDAAPRQPAPAETPGAIARRLLAEPPSPPGEYLFRGFRCRYDYARVFPYLGTVPDVTLARVIGIERRRVTGLRRRLGIARATSRAFALADPLLGTMPDRLLADRVGLHKSTVSERRRRLGIPPYRGSIHHRRDAAEALLRDFADALERARL